MSGKNSGFFGTWFGRKDTSGAAPTAAFPTQPRTYAHNPFGTSPGRTAIDIETAGYGTRPPIQLNIDNVMEHVKSNSILDRRIGLGGSNEFLGGAALELTDLGKVVILVAKNDQGQKRHIFVQPDGTRIGYDGKALKGERKEGYLSTVLFAKATYLLENLNLSDHLEKPIALTPEHAGLHAATETTKWTTIPELAANFVGAFEVLLKDHGLCTMLFARNNINAPRFIFQTKDGSLLDHEGKPGIKGPVSQWLEKNAEKLLSTHDIRKLPRIPLLEKAAFDKFLEDSLATFPKGGAAAAAAAKSKTQTLDLNGTVVQLAVYQKPDLSDMAGTRTRQLRITANMPKVPDAEKAEENDCFVVIDRSGSMNDRFGEFGTKLSVIQVALTQSIGNLLESDRALCDRVHVHLIPFDSEASCQTSVLADSALTAGISALSPRGGTEFSKFQAQIQSAHLSDSQRPAIVLILSDGDNYDANFALENYRAALKAKFGERPFCVLTAAVGTDLSPDAIILLNEMSTEDVCEQINGPGRATEMIQGLLQYALSAENFSFSWNVGGEDDRVNTTVVRGIDVPILMEDVTAAHRDEQSLSLRSGEAEAVTVSLTAIPESMLPFQEFVKELNAAITEAKELETLKAIVSHLCEYATECGVPKGDADFAVSLRLIKEKCATLLGLDKQWSAQRRALAAGAFRNAYQQGNGSSAIQGTRPGGGGPTIFEGYNCP